MSRDPGMLQKRIDFFELTVMADHADKCEAQYAMTDNALFLANLSGVEAQCMLAKRSPLDERTVFRLDREINGRDWRFEAY